MGWCVRTLYGKQKKLFPAGEAIGHLGAFLALYTLNDEFTMMSGIRQLYLSIEEEKPDQRLYERGHTDVIVVLESGEKYGASFFAYQNLEVLQKEHMSNGEFLNGSFFWAPNMVLVEQCTRRVIYRVIRYLIDEGDFKTVFKKNLNLKMLREACKIDNQLNTLNEGFLIGLVRISQKVKHITFDRPK